VDNVSLGWQQLESRINGLTGRERFYLLLVILVALYGVWDVLLHSPRLKEQADLRNSLAEAESRVATASQLVQSLLQRQRVDPNVGIRQRLARLEEEMDQLEVRKQEMAAAFLNPYAMAGLLQNLLKSQGGLTLLGMETLPAQPLVDPAIAAKEERPKDAPPPPMIYRHDIVMEFEGGYFDMVRYLKSLEIQPIFWESAEFLVKSYPRSRVRLQVYTLSFEKEWLGV
jgi:MSHA biogenesis protein MshJ